MYSHTHTFDPKSIQMRYICCISIQPYVMSHMYGSCHTWMGHVTHEWVMSRMTESCHSHFQRCCLVCVTWLPCVWHDLFICVTGLFYMCDRTLRTKNHMSRLSAQTAICPHKHMVKRHRITSLHLSARGPHKHMTQYTHDTCAITLLALHICKHTHSPIHSSAQAALYLCTRSPISPHKQPYISAQTALYLCTDSPIYPHALINGHRPWESTI